MKVPRLTLPEDATTLYNWYTELWSGEYVGQAPDWYAVNHLKSKNLSVCEINIKQILNPWWKLAGLVSPASNTSDSRA